MRDLVRTRADLVDDRKRMMQRIGALLQRHGRVWRAPRWTCQHRAWLDRQSFTEPALEAALRTYLAALDARDAELAVLERQLRGCWASVDPLAPMVRQLGCYRGIAELTALTLAAEVADFRLLGQMYRDAGRGQFLRDIPPPGAPLDRERDVLAAGEPRQPTGR